jgi:hypothetical protein
MAAPGIWVEWWRSMFRAKMRIPDVGRPAGGAMSGRAYCPLKRVVFAGLFLASSLAIDAGAAWAAEPYSIEATQLQAADLSPAVASSLNAQGSRIFTYSNGLKMSICEIFWATTVSAQDTRPATGRTSYGNLKPGTLLGVIRFLSEAGEEYREDSHDQKLKPGYYTMRYALLPGGEASDFVLLSPAAADQDPKSVLPVDQLKRQGRLASGTDEPAVLRLVPAEEGKKDLPAVRMDEGGTCILQVKLNPKPSASSAHELDLAVILVNPVPEDDGS